MANLKMSLNYFMIFFVTLFCSVLFLVAEGRSNQKYNDHIVYILNEEGNEDGSRFLNGGSSGAGTTPTALNDLITQVQDKLENLRPQGGTDNSAPTFVVVGGGGAGIGTGVGNAGNNGGIGTGSNTNNNIANLVIPQAVAAALGNRNVSPVRRRRRRPSKKVISNKNQKRKPNKSRPQVFFVGP